MGTNSTENLQTSSENGHNSALLSSSSPAVEDLKLSSDNASRASNSNGVANGVCAEEVEVYDLDHVKRDFYDQNETAVVVLYLKSVVSNSVKVAFEPFSFTVYFRSTDEAFLQANHKSLDTVFRWHVPNLRGEIVPSQCHHVLTEHKLEVRLRKSVAAPWSRVDNPNASSSSAPSSPPQITVSGAGASSPPRSVKDSTTTTSNSTPSSTPIQNGTNNNDSSSLNKSTSLPKISLDDSALNNQSPLTSSPKPTTTSSLSIDVSALSEHNNSSKSLYRSRVGMRGLVNQSNNCYQNAVIQILANSPHLRQYCLERFIESDINRANPLGSKGKMIFEFVKLIRELWASGENVRLPPVDTAQSVGLVAASRFRPFFQHDAQEFVTYLLDTIHEDLNRAYGRQNSSTTNNNNENPTAESAWASFMQRNDSPLVEMFYGQVCNKITCQHCFKESNAYDPFMMLPLPIARPSKSVELSCLYVPTPLSPRDPPVRIQLSVPACVTSEEMKQAIRSQLNISHVTCELKLYALQNSTLTHFWRASDVYQLTRQRWAGPKGGIDVLIYETQQSGSGGGSISTAAIGGGGINNNKKQSQNVTVHVVQMMSCSQAVILECACCQKRAEKSDLPRCTRCQGVAYCGAECQKAHWKVHKANCLPFEQPIGLPLCFTVSQSISYEKFLKMVEIGVKRFVVWTCQQETSHPLQKHVTFELAPDDAGQVGKPAKKQPTPQRVEVNSSNLHSVLSEAASNGHVLKLRLFWMNGRAGPCRLQMAQIPLSQYELLQITIPVSQDRVTLNDCFRLYFEPELMHSANAWMCPQCKKNRTAIQRSLISRYPRYLIVYLKRFSQDGYVHKDREHVMYPSILDVSSFVADEALAASGGGEIAKLVQAGRQRQTSSASQPIAYHLYGVVNHYGTMQFGHYTSCARLPSVVDATANEVPWRMFDDELVEEISPNRVVDMPDAYILFYILAEPPPPSPPPQKKQQIVEEEIVKPNIVNAPASTAVVDEVVEDEEEVDEDDDEEMAQMMEGGGLGASVEDLIDCAAVSGNNKRTSKQQKQQQLSIGMSDLLLNDDTVD